MKVYSADRVPVKLCLLTACDWFAWGRSAHLPSGHRSRARVKKAQFTFSGVGTWGRKNVMEITLALERGEQGSRRRETGTGTHVGS